MHFVITCVDKPDHGHVRAENRPAHLDHLKAQGPRILAAGPTTSDDGASVTGSVIILDCADRAQAEAFAAADPYSQADLFQQVEIKAWRKVLPAA
jgi:uncharacterized protein YciI